MPTGPPLVTQYLLIFIGEHLFYPSTSTAISSPIVFPRNTCKLQNLRKATYRFSEQHPETRFYHLDIDDNPEVAEELGVSHVPVFLFFKNGERVHSLAGSSIVKLDDALKAHY